MPLDVATASFGPVFGGKDGTDGAGDALGQAVSRVSPRPRRSGSRANTWADLLPAVDRVYAGGQLPFSHNFPRDGEDEYSRLVRECSDPGFVWVSGLFGYHKQKVACRKCRHCLFVSVNARATAIQMELETSEWAFFLTLTISPKGVLEMERLYGAPRADAMLDLRHMARFHDRIRKNMERGLGSFAGVKATSWRYVQCGEYGDLKGRAHYHVIVFGTGDPPSWPVAGRKGRVHIPEWGFGHVTISGDVDRGVAYYLSAYVDKKYGGDAVHSASKFPAIGAKYARNLGAAHALIGARQPPAAWRVTMRGKVRDRTSLLQGTRQREYLFGMSETAGVPLWDMYKRADPSTHAAIKAAIVGRLNKEQREAAKILGQQFRWAESPEKAALVMQQIDELFGGEHFGRNRDIHSRPNSEPEADVKRIDPFKGPPLPAELRSDWVPVGWRDSEEAQATARAWNASLEFRDTFEVFGGFEGESPPLRRVTRFAAR